MLKKFYIVLCACSMLVGSAAALTREARSLYVGDLHFGYSTPLGNYDGIGPLDFPDFSLSAEEAFDPTYHVGFHLGKISNERFNVGVGFNYTKVNINDDISDALANHGASIDTSLLRINQFDILLSCDYYLATPFEESFLPFFGAELITGLTSLNPPGPYRSETEFSIGLAARFGADLKIWSAVDKKSFVTLSSLNSWQLAGSGNRPRYLNIGGGIRYFFRP